MTLIQYLIGRTCRNKIHDSDIRVKPYMVINQSLVRPEDHLGPEQEFFSQAYVKHLQKNLKFYPRIQTRVNKALKKVAKDMKKKPKDITYVGIHNRRTDHMTFMKKHMKREELEELGVDFFMDGMDYFR